MLLSLFFFGAAIIRPSKTMLKIGLAVSVIPLSLYGINYWYYHIHVPRLNKKTEQSYLGSYRMLLNENDTTGNIRVQLTLNDDNTFFLDSNDVINFAGKGKWRAGATDAGDFEFTDDDDSLKFLVSPYSENKLMINENFIDRKSLFFIKE